MANQLKRFFITELPLDAFSGMPELEMLNLEYTGLRSLVLKDDVVENLQLLRMAGNPLHCDCHTRWLWNLATKKENKLQLPLCQTPFSAKGIPLTKLPGNC